MHAGSLCVRRHLKPAAWYLDYESSRLSFISTKNATLSEVGRFLVMHGKVDDKGQARLRVELDSVSTESPVLFAQALDTILQLAWPSWP
ncbi:hypothetical protein ACG3P0_34480, partial [Pseudomonas aeruginosa]